MIILLTGASHTGKTVIAQRLLETLHIPTLSLDHIKMGLIRSGMTDLTAKDDDLLVELIWPMAVGIIKTCLENKQHLILEGIYIPADFASYFEEEELDEICYMALVLGQNYIDKNLKTIIDHRSDMEKRQDNFISEGKIKRENLKFQEMVEHFNLPHILIDNTYDVEKIVEKIILTCKGI